MPRLSGRVIEKWSRVPVVGALVIVNGITVIADTDGNFSAETPYSSAEVQVMHINHEPLSEVVAMAAGGGDTQVEIVLTPIVRAL